MMNPFRWFLRKLFLESEGLQRWDADPTLGRAAPCKACDTGAPKFALTPAGYSLRESGLVRVLEGWQLCTREVALHRIEGGRRVPR